MRRDELWNLRAGGYVEPLYPGYNILVRGTDKYVNFGVTVGDSGYGLRDNSGTMQFKNNSGSWTDIGDMLASVYDPAGGAKQVAFLDQLPDITTKWTKGGDNIGAKKLLGSIDNQAIGLITNNLERLTILENGNVGIGTTSPEYKLQIAGGSGLTALKLTGAVTTTTDGADITAIQMGRLGATYRGVEIVAWQDGEDYDLNGLKFRVHSTTGATDVPTDAMTIKSNGNVGIGTTSPGNKLTIQQAAASGGTLDSGYGLGIDGNGITGIQILSGDAQSGRIVFGDSAGNPGQISYYHTDNSLRFNTNSGEKVRIDNTGNVGIGTTTPSQKLDVSGNININTNGTDALISTYKGADSVGYNIFIGGGGQSSIGEVGATYKGSYNTANGYQALYSNTTGYYNTANGYRALYSNTTGYLNTANGMYSLYYNTTGSYNTANGYDSLYSNTTGTSNTANGYLALYSNTTGSSNTANGYRALFSNTTGVANSALGYQAGRYISDGTTGRVTGNYGLYLGYNTKASDQATTNEIVIGYDATGAGSNTAVYGNTSMTKHIFSNGNVGIGTTSPSASLHIKAGTATAGTAPLKLTSGTLNTTAEAGAIEFDGTDLYITI